MRKQVKLCDVLSRALTDAGRGVRVNQLFNMRTGKWAESFVGLRSGEFARSGIIVNYCPFCGADLSRHIKKSAR